MLGKLKIAGKREVLNRESMISSNKFGISGYTIKGIWDMLAKT